MGHSPGLQASLGPSAWNVWSIEPLENNLVGGFNLPLWKWWSESQLGWWNSMKFPIYRKSYKSHVPVTTKQSYVQSMALSLNRLPPIRMDYDNLPITLLFVGGSAVLPPLASRINPPVLKFPRLWTSQPCLPVTQHVGTSKFCLNHFQKSIDVPPTFKV